eukprot:scaffold48_cov311-Pinguiococcus_pyrenoidosus.AAC.262
MLSRSLVLPEQREDDVVGLVDDLAVDLRDGDLARGRDLAEPARLVAVAGHGHLVHLVGHPQLLEREPDLLAVRTPSRRVAVQRDVWLRLVSSVEEPQSGLGMWRSPARLTKAQHVLFLGTGVFFPHLLQLLPSWRPRRVEGRGRGGLEGASAEAQAREHVSNGRGSHAASRGPKSKKRGTS